MISKLFLKCIGLTVLLLFTTGIILPWLISNFVLPVWMILFTLGAIITIWGMLLQPIFKRLNGAIYSINKDKSK